MKKFPARGGRRISAAVSKGKPPAKPRSSRKHPIPPVPEDTPLAVPDRPPPALDGAIRRLEEDEGRLRAAIEDLRKLLAAAAPAERAASAAEVLDETARTFSRAVSEVVDRRAEEVLARIAPLHQRLREEALALGGSAPPGPEAVRGVLEDAVGNLGRALEVLGGGFIAPQVGEPYDPLIHLAVGEISVPGGEDGRIARVVRPGYRSGRGKVVLPARVLVARN